MTATRRNWLLGALGALLLIFAWHIRAVLNPLIAAYFLAYVLHPLVLRLQARGWSRLRSVNTIFVTAGGLAVVLAVGLGIQALQYSREIASEDWRDRQVAKVDHFLEEHQDSVRWGLGVADISLDEKIPSAEGVFAELHEEYLERRAELTAGQDKRFAPLGIPVRAIFGSVLELISFLILLPIYTYFLLFELERIHLFIARYIPKRERRRISRVGGKVGEVISAFFRGRLTVCFLKGSVITAGLAALGVKYALLLGMGAGFMALVPFAGPVLAFLMGFLLALQQPAAVGQEEMTLFGALWRTGLVYGLAELLEGYYLTPKILGGSLGLHPVVVLVSIFAGAAAFGMFGALLALPVTSALVILFREFVLPPLARFADEDG
jgi:predicted PurR-regulated permease PerM